VTPGAGPGRDLTLGREVTPGRDLTLGQ
jgi:hypothetical protein